MSTTRALLDTHAFLWLMEGSKELSSEIIKTIESFGQNHALYLSAISLWEFVMLEKKGRIILHQPCLQWLEHALKSPELILEPLSPLIAVESSQLPGEFHGDPSDRLIVASARALGATLITRDHQILQYAKNGHILMY